MRLGLLGPALGKQAFLRSASRFLTDEIGVERIVYLGIDGAMDKLVASFATELVGEPAEDARFVERVTERCIEAGVETTLDCVARERKRLELRMFESLPGESTRSVEIIGGKVMVMLYDKAMLVEDDILPATLLLFGRNREPMLKQVGRRWFLSPGVFPKAGILVIEEEDTVLSASLYDAEHRLLETRKLEAPKTLRMRVAGS